MRYVLIVLLYLSCLSADSASGGCDLLRSLGEAPELQELDLSRNKLSRTGGEVLTSLLLQPGQFSALTALNVSGNGLGDVTASRLVDAISSGAAAMGGNKGEQLQLSSLDLSRNGVSSNTSRALSTLLLSSRHLHTLSLGWNGLRHNAAMDLVTALGENTSLKVCF